MVFQPHNVVGGQKLVKVSAAFVEAADFRRAAELERLVALDGCWLAVYHRLERFVVVMN